MLRIALEDVVEQPLAAGYTMRDLDYERDARRVFEVIDVAFAEFRVADEGWNWSSWDGFIGSARGARGMGLAGRRTRGPDRRRVRRVRLRGGRPRLDPTARRGEGPPWARAGERHAPARVGEVPDAGYREASLSTDSRGDALARYEHLGMRVRTSATQW